MSMIERQIFTIINDRLDWFKADSGQRFERFLAGELELSAEEAARGKIYFAGGTNSEGDTIEARPPTLIHGYARTGGPFPCWALVLGGEQEAQAYLNDDALVLDIDGERAIDPETGRIVDPKIRRVRYTFNILVIADNPDVTLWYYHLLKRIVLSAHDAFFDADLESPTVTGADLAPDPRYLPSDVFIRQLTLTLEAEECWTEDFEGGVGTSITGIAVDDTGDSITAGDADGSVSATITTYAAGS
jgi:hypothetical protein